MIVRFLAEAQGELLAAVSHYESLQPGLGERFRTELSRTLIVIGDMPELCRLRPGGYRRINLRTFPYYVPFIMREKVLVVMAVAHVSRRQHYWMGRRTRPLED